MSKYSFCSANARCHLFFAYCSAYYGSPLWKLHGSSLQKLSVAWRKCVRRVLNVHYTTHLRYLLLIINKPDISTELMCRFNTFWSSCVYSPNKYVNFVSRMVNSSRSIVPDNMKVLLSYLNNEYDEYVSLLNNRAGVKDLMMAKYRNMCGIDDMYARTAID